MCIRDRVYAFAGALDRVVPAERSERMIAAIRNAGGKKALIRGFDKEGDVASRLVFSTKELYDWMFSQRRECHRQGRLRASWALKFRKFLLVWQGVA